MATHLAIMIMDKKLETIVQALQENFSVTFEEFRGETHVFVKVENIIEALTFCAISMILNCSQH